MIAEVAIIELGVVIISIIAGSVLLNSITEIIYWKYRDWRDKDESG